jgi:hypothetical protein
VLVRAYAREDDEVLLSALRKENKVAVQRWNEGVLLSALHEGTPAVQKGLEGSTAHKDMVQDRMMKSFSRPCAKGWDRAVHKGFRSEMR